MRAWQRVVGIGGIVGAIVVGGGLSPSAQAGEVSPAGTLNVRVSVVGTRAAEVTTIIPEVYQNGSKVTDCDTVQSSSASGLYGNVFYNCSLPTGTYQLGANGLVDAPEYRLFADCTSALPPEQFVGPNIDVTIEPGGTSNCNIDYDTTVLILDKEVADPFEFGPDPMPDAGDFTLEVWNAGGDPYTTGVDPANATCPTFGPYDDCFIVDLPDGDYVLGEVPIPGYSGYVSSCTNGSLDEQFPGANAEITAAVERYGSYIKCLIRNDYAEGDVTITHAVTNDDGGTATVTDFTVELFDSSNALVDSAVCPATGPCLEGSYPVDDYTVGVSGPAGYTQTASQQIIVPTEPLTDPNASFTLDPFAQVTVDVVSNDAPTTTTSTTTTTTVAPTTVAPTTAAPTTVAQPTVAQPTTTALDAGAATLPETGQSSRSGTVMLVALGLLALGVVATRLSRRPA